AVFLDVEMPVQNYNGQTHVVYRAVSDNGEEVTAFATSAEVEWGLWLKSKKAPDRTTRLEWEQGGELISATQGAVYEVHDDPRIGQHGGIGPEQFAAYGWADGRAEYNRLRRMFQAARQIFGQSPAQTDSDDG